MSVTAYIALGSNLDEPEQQLYSAVAALKNLPESRLLAISPFYRTDPVGPAGQPDYINAVAAIETSLTPIALLDALQAIEKGHGRVRTVRWGARVLDLDILLYGHEIIESERLTVPHRDMSWRNFVLIPLADIAPDITLPTGQSLKKLLQNIDRKGIERLSDSLVTEA
ncbi:2-amino-4-hydroxy-6-hydroxymethyldihydropteridine diphosphokinase [Kistimonas asteriae]|uniref:2-amino-4-hydroxy-6- hydroxymethyldihydropteridine diphosphokinase n=1 Tax=Kistimonas asteriae TaxID=517724 RepID=UPI001BA73D3B|nr:2-amino-4-hydroxy-6-hydroxymethyldihydropteridine diphosphokinase [Kistimonas asteriae]